MLGEMCRGMTNNSSFPRVFDCDEEGGGSNGAPDSYHFVAASSRSVDNETVCGIHTVSFPFFCSSTGREEREEEEGDDDDDDKAAGWHICAPWFLVLASSTGAGVKPTRRPFLNSFAPRWRGFRLQQRFRGGGQCATHTLSPFQLIYPPNRGDSFFL